MRFDTAARRLGDLGVTQEEMADALGVSRSSVKAALLDEDSPNYRRPPDDWRPKLLELAEGREGAFSDLARELREAADE